MEIVRADILGFCSGVRRAVNAAEEALASGGEGTVWSLGPLIHNPLVLAGFGARGLRVLGEDGLDGVSPLDTVVVRAHGVRPSLLRALRSRAGRIVDATCPLVMQSQKRASEYARRGYAIVFAGDRGHGEVVGIEGFVDDAAAKSGRPKAFFVVRDAAELAELFGSGRIPRGREAVLLSQTTFSPAVFEEIRGEFWRRVPGAKVVGSICPATAERQDALVRLCARVDGVLVVGGRESANTNRLYAAAASACGMAALIESAGEIPDAFRSLARVGLTAGASTPDDVIAAVEDSLRSGSPSPCL